MGNGTMFEKRRCPRIAGDKLPAPLRTLSVSFGDGAERYRATTIDASVSGISFKVDLPVFAIKEYNITLTAQDAHITLRDELVYAKPLDLESSRVSVHFTKQGDLERYAKLINDSIR